MDRQEQLEYWKKYYQEHRLERQLLSKKWREDHKEEIFLSKQEYRLKNKEKIKEHKRQYYLDNKDEILEYSKKKWAQYYQKHKEERSIYRKEYYQRNKELISGRPQTFKEWLTRSWGHRRKALKDRGIRCDMTREEFAGWCEERRYLIEPLLELQKYDRKFGPSIDRINSTGHYSVDNIRILTWGENSTLANRSRKK